jgi:hypothetical protein
VLFAWEVSQVESATHGRGADPAASQPAPESPRELAVSPEGVVFLDAVARSHLGGPFVRLCFEHRTCGDAEVRSVDTRVALFVQSAREKTKQQGGRP